MVAARDTLHLQLEVQLQRFGHGEIRQTRVTPKRSGQEVERLRAFVLDQCVCGHVFCDHVTSLLLLQGAQQRGLMGKKGNQYIMEEQRLRFGGAEGLQYILNT